MSSAAGANGRMTGAQDTTAVFEANRTRLVRIAYRMLGSFAEAEDVVQETLLTVARTMAATLASSAMSQPTAVALPPSATMAAAKACRPQRSRGAARRAGGRGRQRRHHGARRRARRAPG